MALHDRFRWNPDRLNDTVGAVRPPYSLVSPDTPEGQRSAATGLRVAMVGTYPPRRCGIATYSMDMTEALIGAGARVSVIAVDDGVEPYDYPDQVARTLAQGDSFGYAQLATDLNAEVDAVVLQHEFGIFGGDAGDDILLFLRRLSIPVTTVLHTILREPDTRQFEVMREITKRSSALVVMSEAAREILCEVYEVSPQKIRFVPHGVPDCVDEAREETKRRFGWEGRKVVLTFGLLSPGKGIEVAISALGQVVAKDPSVLYVLAGQTHPHVRRTSGESYREELVQLAEDCGLGDNLVMLDRYLGLDELRDLLNACDAYVTPYLNPQQITSGTLSYAVGAGRTVISTPYIHAQELLGDGTGILVPFRCPIYLAEAVERVFANDEERASFEAKALAKGDEMRWSRVGERMTTILRRTMLALEPASPAKVRPPVEIDLDYLSRLVDDTGVLQHAAFDIPRREEGYCTDDNARALTFVQTLLADHPGNKEAERIEAVALSFLAHAWNPQADRFRNFMDYGRNWLEDEGSEESQGRAFAALARSARIASTEGRRHLSLQLVRHALPNLAHAQWPRTQANVLCGLADLLGVSDADGIANEATEIGRSLAKKLVDALRGEMREGWTWLESTVAYDNGRIAEGLIRFGDATNDHEALQAGLAMLGWLVDTQIGADGMFLPIGSNGFWPREGTRALFDQQPIEAASMLLALQAAHQTMPEPRWNEAAESVFDWFFGKNVCRVSVADRCGAFDGLCRQGPNLNRGAESTWAYLAGALAMRSLASPTPSHHRSTPSKNREETRPNLWRKDHVSSAKAATRS